MKIHAPIPVRPSRGFTLLELLVVILIIAILAGFLLPQITEMNRQKNILKTMDLVTKLKTGVSSFKTEYNRLPIDPSVSTGGEDLEVLTDGSTAFVDALLGIPAEEGGENWNPKGIAHAEFAYAHNDRHGIVTVTRPSKLHDMWGKPFHILLDTNGDHQVKNPDVQNSSTKYAQPNGKPAGEFLSTDAVIFSSGPDGIPYTADDIVSWRQNG